LLFLSQHIELFRAALGLSWPALSPAWVTMAAVLAIAAMIALLVQRMIDPVKRLLSDFQDYLTWTLTFLPLLTGLLLKQSGGAEYQNLLVLHIASVELLLLAIPFTKLAHMVTTFSARWYNGAVAGYKGVDV
jgi:nitrate reductase gamma subunit